MATLDQLEKAANHWFDIIHFGSGRHERVHLPFFASDESASDVRKWWRAGSKQPCPLPNDYHGRVLLARSSPLPIASIDETNCWMAIWVEDEWHELEMNETNAPTPSRAARPRDRASSTDH